MFDSATRTLLANFVARSRRLLCGEYNKPGGEITSLLQTYGIQPDGTVANLESLPGLDQRGYEVATTLRELLAYKRANSAGVKAWGKYDPHVYDLIQEQAFTVLNRLCALRMAEKRGILPYPVVSKGMSSDGFEQYELTADKRRLSREERYESFLFSIFDELSLDLQVLFDRFATESLLFPRPDALAELLAEINAPALAPLWPEDETIGWVYQYWNSKEERKAMRDASAAPRNSRELAVRNQFFTPRYVVEFLTDNTLGRIWYEMTKGKTRLKEQCRYLVRRPTEIFLDEGEALPTQNEELGTKNEEPSQEELLRQPVHILHRPLKDPREIRLLDPACGSMHFGLYAFDLYEAIYEEAWDLAKSGSIPARPGTSFSDFCLLTSDFSSKEAFLREVPRLIIEHNIHGIDIDSRAVQIAGLSLWLRAQRSWKKQNLDVADRPRVRRSNVVCAEPMPGSPEMLEEFVKTLDPPLLGELVRTVFDKMQLAGEAGSLLKIEEEIRTAIDTARKEWLKQQDDLLTRKDGSQEEFFATAEQQVIDALRAYAEQADADSYQRRLFADDAARGFAFIDLCRKRYDAIVMNPPFGKPAGPTSQYLKSHYDDGWKDIYAAFFERSLELAAETQSVGAITSLLYFYSKQLRNIRARFVGDGLLRIGVELGGGILDSATVETVLTVLSRSERKQTAFLDLTASTDRHGDLLRCVREDSWTHVELSAFESLFNSPLCYHIGPEKLRLWDEPERLEPDVAKVVAGNHTFNDFRFLRLRLEVEPRCVNESWVTYVKGGDFCPIFSTPYLVFNWDSNGAEPRQYQINEYGTDAQTIQSISHWFKSGITYPRVSSGFSPRAMPGNCIFSEKGMAVFPEEGIDNRVLLALLSSAWIDDLLSAFGRHRAYENSAVANLPISRRMIESLSSSLKDLGEACLFNAMSLDSSEEQSPLFCGVPRHCREHASLRELAEHLDALCDSFNQIDRIVGASLFRAQSAIPSRESPSRSKLFRQKCVPDTIRKSRTPEVGAEIVSYYVGTAFGRWDIRYATGERKQPELPDPFDPLPVCPPGMLQNAEGLPAEPADVPADYPLRISWPGILVDDENHPEDIVARVREAIEVIWKDRAEAIEQEACEILGLKTLRDYFRRPGSFFADHLKRYSKSRRQAPIYWPLSTESGSYTLWIYYHRLTPDTLFACVTNFVAPKQEQTERTLARLGAKAARTSAEEKDYEAAAALIGELATFRAELERLAKIWKPNLNDGVQITAAPLWSLFRLPKWQKTLKETWQKLEVGDYDWSHLSLSLWPERVIPKCTKDRSLAIAHGFDEDLWEEVTEMKGKKSKTTSKPRKDAPEIVARLVAERTTKG